LLNLAKRRGEPPHLREEALLALTVTHDAARGLALARANFGMQRETIDARLLAHAAHSQGDRAALTQVTDWMHATGFEDRRLADLPSTAGART
jgi:hypothetical protein